MLMGLYKRTWKDKSGKRRTSKIWDICYTVPGMGQICESTGTSNKRVAQQIYDARRGEIDNGKCDLLKKAPQLESWAKRYLESVEHQNARRRYASSKENLV